MTPEMPPLPLTGVRVIDFTQMVAGPHCTLWLASLGAEVIRIESPKRPDPFRSSLHKPGTVRTLNNSPIFVTTNLMKRSCCVDIADPDGQRLCHELIKNSDVVVANFRPGVLEQFNMGYNVLREINPGIVMAAISGYGYTGDFAAFQANGPVIQAFSGLSANTGYRGGRPEQFFGTYGDVAAGMTTVLAILAALHHRQAAGQGQFIDVAMAEALILMAPEPVLRAELFAEETRPHGNDEDGFAPHGCYRCSGIDRWIAIATFGEAEWIELTRVLGLDEARSDPRFRQREARWRHRDELDLLVGEATSGWDPAELAAALARAGVAAAPVRTAQDVLKDEQLLEDRFIQAVVQSELGEAYLPGLPWLIETDKGTARPIGPAPEFGEATREILGAVLGLTDEAWEDLHNRGVVA